jgi:phosphoribosyl 1,2-cyclic phosphate phosphodiesterase
VKVTFLGTGTSQGVPVIACECAICTSADPRDNRLRTSMMVEVNGKVIVIDSGPDFRYQMLRAKVHQLDAILFTHEHKDAEERVQTALKSEFSYIFSGINYPGLPRVILHGLENKSLNIQGVDVLPIRVMHYKLPVFGFRIGDFTYITDAKSISEEEKQKMKGSKVLVLNALRREDHISHFTLQEAIDLAKEIGAEQTYLTHISHQLGLHTEVEQELPEGVYLAYDGLCLGIG